MRRKAAMKPRIIPEWPDIRMFILGLIQCPPEPIRPLPHQFMNDIAGTLEVPGEKVLYWMAEFEQPDMRAQRVLWRWARLAAAKQIEWMKQYTPELIPAFMRSQG